MTQSSNPAILPAPVFHDAKHHIKIYQGDCLEILAAIPEATVDLIFADPPYFLSNDGITCHAGRMVSVNKGQWDKSRGAAENHEFNRAWLAAAQRVLKPNGSIWVSGTAHVIHSVGFAMQQLGFKLLNDISWVKPNPPPNLSCRYFTHATETLIWAAKGKKSRHTFHYKLMRQMAGGKQMKSVWEIRPPEPWEKRFGKHPTQKPVALLERLNSIGNRKNGTVRCVYLPFSAPKRTSATKSASPFGLPCRPQGKQLQVLRDLGFLTFLGGAATGWCSGDFTSPSCCWPGNQILAM